MKTKLLKLFLAFTAMTSLSATAQTEGQGEVPRYYNDDIGLNMYRFCM